MDGLWLLQLRKGAGVASLVPTQINKRPKMKEENNVLRPTDKKSSDRIRIIRTKRYTFGRGSSFPPERKTEQQRNKLE